MKKAFILCSGGLDSVTTAFYVKKKLNYSSIEILFFNYGQRNLVMERKCSKLCARSLKAKFKEIKIESFDKIALMHKRNDSLKDTSKESASWYVPARNLVFLSYAISIAEAHSIKNHSAVNIFVGFKNEGREYYPDTTASFLASINQVSKIATKSIPRILAPLIKKDKEDIILLANKLRIDLSKTYSCYIGRKKHCGSCLACRLRKAGFYWANLEDPTEYLQ